MKKYSVDFLNNYIIIKLEINFLKVNFMKNKRTIIVLVAVVAIMAIIGTLVFTACNKKSDDTIKLPTTNYEKVRFAFNGVESSFNNMQKSARTSSEAEAASASENPLDDIFAVYTTGDNQGDVIDELEYDQPPMIQFQCLKSVLEKVGSNYSFGTKYYDEITGEIYLDLENGDKIDKTREDADNYKVAYAFILAISVNIDDKDIITADVSFDIKLTKAGDEYNTHWYVNMWLDYDMQNTTPNYTLLMLTDNREADLAYLGRPQGYEYDYVEVKNNGIVEWRKFVLDASEPIVLDATHADFDAYLYEEDFEFKADCAKWYKNHALYKITQWNEQKNETLARAFVALGLNSTAINPDSFTQKSGTVSDKIKVMYREFSELFRDDVIYSLVCNNETKHGDNNKEYARIGIYFDGYDEEIRQLAVLSDMTGLEYLTTNQTSNDGRILPRPRFFYMYEDGGKGPEITDLSGAQFDFYSIDDNPDTSSPNVHLAYNDFVTSQMENILSFCNYQSNFVLTIGNVSLIIDIFYAQQGGNNQDGSVGYLEVETAWNNNRYIYAYDDIKIQNMFNIGGRHREYSIEDSGEKEVINPSIFYINEKGQRAAQIDVVEMSFFVQDEENVKAPYSIDLSSKENSNLKLSELWKLANAQDILKIRIVINYLEIEENYVDFEIRLYPEENIPLYVAIYGEQQDDNQNQDEQQEELHDFRIRILVQGIRDEYIGEITNIIETAFNNPGNVVPMPENVENGCFYFEFIIIQTTEEELNLSERFSQLSSKISREFNAKMTDTEYIIID